MADINILREPIPFPGGFVFIASSDREGHEADKWTAHCIADKEIILCKEDDQGELQVCVTGKEVLASLEGDAVAQTREALHEFVAIELGLKARTPDPGDILPMNPRVGVPGMPYPTPSTPGVQPSPYTLPGGQTIIWTDGTANTSSTTNGITWTVNNNLDGEMFFSNTKILHDGIRLNSTATTDGYTIRASTNALVC